MKTEKSAFSQNLIRIRQKRGYSQSEMAKLLGTSKSTYSNWENNREPKYDKLLDIVETLNVDVMDLLLIQDQDSYERKYSRSCEFLKQQGLTVEEKLENAQTRGMVIVSSSDDREKRVDMPKEDMIKKVEYIQERGGEARSRIFKDYTQEYFKIYLQTDKS